MSDLLKEAIADAKAVRETALQNAKVALEEAFTPHLKSMLSAKLSEDDMEDENDEFGHDDEEEAEEGMYMDADEEPEMDMGDEEPEMDMGDEEPEMEEEGIIEIDGVKYAPVVSEDEVFESDELDEEDNLDLESVIKELESEINEDEDLEENTDETVEETFEIDESLFEEEKDDDEDEDEDEKVEEEVDQSSGIGKGTGRGNTDTSSGIGTANKKLKETQHELKEYKEAVKFLKDKLHEVNILNAKLLFTNKIFKTHALSNDQKMKVVENFDRARTTREIKLVYTTLCENFANDIKLNKKSINEVASAKAGSTRPSRKIITEESAVAERFKKLAGIL
jgi:hypothetical protein